LKKVEGYGSPYAKLMIIGIAPGDEELIQEKPLVGPSGRILKEDLAEAGIGIDECYRTNVFKYKLPDNDFARFKEIGLSLEPAIEELREEINAINPNCILGLGDPVLYSLTGKSGKYNNIGVWRGSIISSLGNYKSVFTWHPAASLHGGGEGTFRAWQNYVRKFDVKRAVDQSYFPEFRLPQRFLHIAKDSSDVYRFLERALDNPYCAVDISDDLSYALLSL